MASRAIGPKIYLEREYSNRVFYIVQDPKYAKRESGRRGLVLTRKVMLLKTKKEEAAFLYAVGVAHHMIEKM